jgi:hypothetical protein
MADGFDDKALAFIGASQRVTIVANDAGVF